MRFHINKDSEISAHEQLREQIIFLISTGELAIGEEMPSVRTLSRQLGISLNTVSKVYSELVRASWLIERPGAHHIVVERKDATRPSPPVAGLDDLIDRIISLAQAHGYSLQQLATRIRGRLLEQPPDHFLVVEPDPGMGDLMREEIRGRIRYAPPSCGIHLLQQNPAIGIGAVLITPTYLADKLETVPTHRRRVLPVSYSPLDEIMVAISKLTQPSMIGLLSVSGAGLKTISGMIAPAIGKRHSIHLFVMERFDLREGSSQYHLRRYRLQEYRPGDILRPAAASDPPFALESYKRKLEECSVDDTATAADLRCMDILICDSIASSLIHHSGLIRYQLLSEQSLTRIEAEAESLRRHQERDVKSGGFAPGTVLSERYRIVALLGRGGMGEVYRAEDLKLGIAVALKFLPASLQNDAAALARFHGEVRNARQVAHSNVCRVYDIGEVNGQHFLTMEYIDGEDLASLLRRIGRLPADKALETAHQICAGLAAAHDCGLLHRDLKPANIMLDGRGRVRITDFGLALNSNDADGGSETAGTPAYMAPEQIGKGEASVQSDIYSLGLVFYELFTGRLPYKANTAAEWWRAHLESSPRKPSSVVKEIDPAVESVILRCLEKDPARRPSSVRQVAAAFPGGDPPPPSTAPARTYQGDTARSIEASVDPADGRGVDEDSRTLLSSIEPTPKTQT